MDNIVWTSVSHASDYGTMITTQVQQLCTILRVLKYIGTRTFNGSEINNKYCHCRVFFFFFFLDFTANLTDTT